MSLPVVAMKRKGRMKSNKQRAYERMLAQAEGPIPRRNLFKKSVEKVIEQNNEYKRLDAFRLGAAMTAINQFHLLNGQQAGVQLYGRTGNKIEIKSIELNFEIHNNSDATDNYVKLLLLQDREPMGVEPTMAQIFNDTTGSTQYNRSNSLRNLDNSTRFKILKSWSIHLGAYLDGEKFSRAKMIEYYRKANIKTQYIKVSAGLTIADILKNSLYFVVCSDNFYANISYEFTSRLRYQDS